MNAAVIKVAFANPPKAGKKLASIKTDEGAIYGVWPDKFGLFQPGRTYQVEFSTRNYQGKDYHTIVKCEPVQEENGTGTRTPGAKSGSDESDFVARCLAASIAACAVTLTEQGLADHVRLLRAAYRKAMV